MDKVSARNISSELEEMVLTGHFANGQHLDETTLAEMFGVSRTPIREALQQLVTSGLTQKIPRRGVFIKNPTAIELLEMFEVMAELEAACVRFAALRISDHALSALYKANEKCELSVQAGDTEGYFQENETFHQILYQESANSFLRAETERLQRRLRPFRRIQLKLRGRLGQSMAEHKAILDALSQNKGELAAEEMRKHVSVQGEKFHHLIASSATL